MIIMQYRIGLPADYDMAIIRKRIADRGHLTDDFPYLAFKAYLYADRNAAYASDRENLYAPFYLWHNTEGMNAFLTGAGFTGVIESFGRPVVRTGSVWQASMAQDLSAATYATREIVSIPAHRAIGDVRNTESECVQTDLDRGALAVIRAFDPTEWTVTRFGLWRDAVSRPLGDEVDVYQVAHISQPATKQ